MKKIWFLLVLTFLLLLMVEEIESKKIPNPYKVLGIQQNADD